MKKHNKNNNINLIVNTTILFLCFFIEKLTDSFDPQLGLKRWLVSRQAEDNLHDCQTITRKKFNDIILIGRKEIKEFPRVLQPLSLYGRYVDRH